MPAGKEMKSTWALDQLDDEAWLGPLLWRNARDYLVVKYEEVEGEYFPWEDEIDEANLVEIIGEEYVDGCTRMVQKVFV